MGSWSDILGELKAIKGNYDELDDAAEALRHRYLGELHQLTGRNVVTYYSGWMAGGGKTLPGIYNIGDDDKNGFINSFTKMDPSLGLDLFLHSPGGEVASAESIIHYVRQVFGDDVRAIVPQISMSGATIMALMGKQIIMGKPSNLGPIDPMIHGLSAQAVLDEFEHARQEIREKGTAAAALWQPILHKYQPTLLYQCENALKWSLELARNTLLDGMLKGLDPAEAQKRAEAIAFQLCDDDTNYMHVRHIHRDRCREIGLEIVDLEEDPRLLNLVMSVHNANMITFQFTQIVKIIESHQGETMQKNVYNKYEDND